MSNQSSETKRNYLLQGISVLFPSPAVTGPSPALCLRFLPRELAVPQRLGWLGTIFFASGASKEKNGKKWWEKDRQMMGKWWENDGILIWAAVKSRLPVEQDLSSWSTIIYLSACLFIHHLPTHGYYAWWRWECTYMFLFCAIMTYHDCHHDHGYHPWSGGRLCGDAGSPKMAWSFCDSWHHIWSPWW